ncbi:hypothetical protein IWX63_001970 [Arthrobacter sp. CAN_A2]|uniref:hypothetical protein n=1 Tax=Arthrobacter sp. CAN_A2 TaxID=2787718 RepID=UPI0018EF4E82
MTFTTDMEKVHALAVESARIPLRERQILMVQQGPSTSTTPRHDITIPTTASDPAADSH